MPPRKKLVKKPTTPKKPTFKVVFFHAKEGDYDGKDTYYWPDEAGAVLFAMRHSRDMECRAIVSADGKAICQFGPREYDVAAMRHAWLDKNELAAAHHALYSQVNQARREREGSNPPKKKVLKKR